MKMGLVCWGLPFGFFVVLWLQNVVVIKLLVNEKKSIKKMLSVSHHVEQ